MYKRTCASDFANIAQYTYHGAEEFITRISRKTERLFSSITVLWASLFKHIFPASNSKIFFLYIRQLSCYIFYLLCEGLWLDLLLNPCYCTYHDFKTLRLLNFFSKTKSNEDSNLLKRFKRSSACSSWLNIRHPRRLELLLFQEYHLPYLRFLLVRHPWLSVAYYLD